MTSLQPPPPPPPTAPLNVATHDDGRRTAWWWAAAGGAMLMALIGLIRPGAALPIAIATAIALAALLSAYALARLFAALRAAPRSAFAPALYERPIQLLPHHVARLLPDEQAKNPTLAPGARTAIVAIATERLWARRGLNVHRPEDHLAIERLVSPALWGVIRPDVYTRERRLLPRPEFRHGELPPVLDELDRL